MSKNKHVTKIFLLLFAVLFAKGFFGLLADFVVGQFAVEDQVVHDLGEIFSIECVQRHTEIHTQLFKPCHI